MVMCVFEMAVDWNWYVFEWIGNEAKGIGQINEEDSEC